MSYRVCGNCDYVINNRTHDGDDCPRCQSLEMCDPVMDSRNWDELYKEQMARLSFDPPHKYKVGSRWIMTNPDTKEEFTGVVLDLNDKRIKKIKMSSDVCLYFPEIDWGTTYDAEFLDGCCRLAP